ncbi:Mercaptopyruvate sulfurtransferase/thiosulfate sulfurtransferase [Plasmopara halstedii]|uniref:Mercaptopyruvate sulfurtransferase/thiosulfate sulfurtransferase n=1 Tax=Plasmopara halstedii TaxID=4781 RepID=A0A0P1B3C6_PLAHL|nr:Mercaptopyruvate sulfurtransferase/thiosulfate sulfurtransferase [Plasmopara halstedii]CEG49270.1 Mercaptopyruvate sulfurtransferase/thiosulfate sulfurtransferase [Plasmopara halstedii]|eukprot:XP_024585639.1 Mercaptopyruvate sulfurtransferase/thiosulfate sulfurtransferase [Plasmopara halstedii]
MFVRVRSCWLRRCSASSSRSFSALVDSKWVRAVESNRTSELLFLDCNHPSLYDRGHIPEAISLTLASSLFKDPTPQATGVVDLELFVDMIKELPVSENTTIIFYDDELSLKATRTWWVFRHYGFPLKQLKVLDGGLKQWQDDGNEVKAEKCNGVRNHVVPWRSPVDSHKLVGLQDVQKGIAESSTQFVDARSSGEYWGDDANGNARVGHIPRAFNFNWIEGVNLRQNGKFKTKEELDKIFVDHFHLDKEKPVITYCQRGIRAAHTAFALEQVMGFKDVKIYEDSMLHYLNREDTEVVQK